MKKLILASLMLVSSVTMAEGNKIASGSVDVYSAKRYLEVVIDGDAAATLFAALDVAPVQVGNYLNKVTKSLVCGKNLNNNQISCSLTVDQEGIQ